MRCKEVINALLRGEVEQVASDEVQKHIAECSHCGELTRVIKEVEQRGRDVLEETEMSEMFVNRVHQMAVRELVMEHASSRRSLWFLLFAKAAIILLVIGFILWWLLRPSKSYEVSREEIASLDSRINNMLFMITWRIADVQQKITAIRNNEDNLNYQLENVRGKIAWNQHLIEQELKKTKTEEEVKYYGNG